MQKILVTGGAGFIGSHTVVELVKSGYQPIVIDDFSNSEEAVIDRLQKIINSPLHFYKGRYQNRKLLTKIFSDHKIDGVIHFAAFKAVGESVTEPLKYYDNNVAGLIDLIRSLENDKILSLVFSSSCTVYGEPDSLPVTENSAIKPAESPYGATKQMCESIIKDVAAAGAIRAVSLRYFNPIGAHPSSLIGELPIGTPANLIPFITQTAAGLRKELTIFGDDYPTPDGSCIRDYIHVVDLAHAHVKALHHLLTQPTGYYDVFNLGTGKGSSVFEVIKTFEQVTGKKVSHQIGPRRKGDVVATYAAVNKANDILGWKAEKTLADALNDAWRWQQSLRKTKREQ